MNGIGWRCDNCGKLDVTVGDALLKRGGYDLPAGWFRVFRADDLATGLDYCSSSCIVDAQGVEVVADHVAKLLEVQHGELERHAINLERGVSSLVSQAMAEFAARSFHDHYERLAPAFGYSTRETSRVKYEDLTSQMRQLMTSTASHVLYEVHALLTATLGAQL